LSLPDKVSDPLNAQKDSIDLLLNQEVVGKSIRTLDEAYREKDVTALTR
jgi:hypothetical protein